MKIKELFENEVTNDQISFTYYFSESIPSLKVKELKQKLEAEFKTFIEVYKADIETIEIYIHMHAKDIPGHDIDNLEPTINALIESTIPYKYDPKRTTKVVYLFSNPTAPIKAPSIKINMSLIKKIDSAALAKYCDCDFFSFYGSTNFDDAKNIEGGVLSFLKIKCKKLHFALIDSSPVLQIVDKYAESKNVLQCQKELIQNGFKEYAK